MLLDFDAAMAGVRPVVNVAGATASGRWACAAVHPARAAWMEDIRTSNPFVKIGALTLILLTGCTTFHVTQIDESPGDRSITTEIKGTAWFSSAQSISKITAITTDREQRFNAGAIGQQGATNTAAALNALARIAEAVRPTP